MRSFCGLNDIGCPSFSRTKTLELMANVKSYVIMLDLDCDDLILQMFHHLLDAIDQDHDTTIQD